MVVSGGLAGSLLSVRDPVPWLVPDRFPPSLRPVGLFARGARGLDHVYH